MFPDFRPKAPRVTVTTLAAQSNRPLCSILACQPPGTRVGLRGKPSGRGHGRPVASTLVGRRCCCSRRPAASVRRPSRRWTPNSTSEHDQRGTKRVSADEELGAAVRHMSAPEPSSQGAPGVGAKGSSDKRPFVAKLPDICSCATHTARNHEGPKGRAPSGAALGALSAILIRAATGPCTVTGASQVGRPMATKISVWRRRLDTLPSSSISSGGQPGW